MNYQKIYNQLIKRAQNRTLEEGVYFETHHIIPRCMGGEDTSENLVKLTAREHFLCHWLLVRIHTGNKKIAHAFWSMCIIKRKYQERYIPSSRAYGEAREGVVNSLTRRVVLESTREKLSKQTKKSWTEERKLKYIETNKMRVFTIEHKKNISKALKNRFYGKNVK